LRSDLNGARAGFRLLRDGELQKSVLEARLGLLRLDGRGQAKLALEAARANFAAQVVLFRGLFLLRELATDGEDVFLD
jgi:hypothetical protein